jgi:hypothetical protein
MATWVQIWTFFEALLDLFTKVRGNLVSKEVLDKRFAICKECEYFTGRGCSKCGCCTNQTRSLFNKLAYPTEQCPDVPPRWEKEV